MKIFRTAIWTKILWTASCDCILLDFPVQNNITVCNCSNWEKCKKFLWVFTGVKVSSILSIFLFIKLFYFLHENFHRWCFLMNFQNRFRIWLEGPWRSSVFINLKKLALASMLSLKFLPRPLWRSIFSLKLESYSLPHCKKNCHMLDFLSIFWTATFKNHVWTATFPWTKAVSLKVSVNKVLLKIWQNS